LLSKEMPDSIGRAGRATPGGGFGHRCGTDFHRWLWERELAAEARREEERKKILFWRFCGFWALRWRRAGRAIAELRAWRQDRRRKRSTCVIVSDPSSFSILIRQECLPAIQSATEQLTVLAMCRAAAVALAAECSAQREVARPAWSSNLMFQWRDESTRAS